MPTASEHFHRFAGGELDEALRDSRLPRTLRLMIAAAQTETVRQHYLTVMPALRRAQLAGGGNAAVLHEPLDWEQMPRLGGALDRLYALPLELTEVFGARTSAELRAQCSTVAALYARTAHGAAMPLLYATPADLAALAKARHDGASVSGLVNRRLAAPLVHELMHFAAERDGLVPYLDECIAGWLGVRLLPSLAFGGDGEAMYATPWLAQVGQALARVIGEPELWAAQVGALSWEEALGPRLLEATARLGWAAQCESGAAHFLGCVRRPQRWHKLFFLAAAKEPLDLSLEALDELPFGAIAAPPLSDLDREMLEDALRALCLRTRLVDGVFHVESALTNESASEIAIEVDPTACELRAHDVAPLDELTCLLPPSIAARLPRQRFTLQLRDPEVTARALCTV